MVGILLELGVHQRAVHEGGPVGRDALAGHEQAGALRAARLLGQDRRPRRTDRAAAVAGETNPKTVQDASLSLVHDGRRQVFVVQPGRKAGKAASERVSHDLFS